MASSFSAQSSAGFGPAGPLAAPGPGPPALGAPRPVPPLGTPGPGKPPGPPGPPGPAESADLMAGVASISHIAQAERTPRTARQPRDRPVHSAAAQLHRPAVPGRRKRDLEIDRFCSRRLVDRRHRAIDAAIGRRILCGGVPARRIESDGRYGFADSGYRNVVAEFRRDAVRLGDRRRTCRRLSGCSRGPDQHCGAGAQRKPQTRSLHRIHLIPFVDTCHLGSWQKPQFSPTNILAASLSPRNCHFSIATATLANSPPFGWL